MSSAILQALQGIELAAIDGAIIFRNRETGKWMIGVAVPELEDVAAEFGDVFWDVSPQTIEPQFAEEA